MVVVVVVTVLRMVVDLLIATFQAMKILVAVSWVLTPCSDTIGYKRFGGPFCLLFQGEVH